jgi:threonyl-tRNA synthetase
LGKELELFVIDEEIGKGLPLWLPNGTVIRDELEKYVKELEFHDGFERVTTPQLTKVDLYYKTGHLPYYKEHMFPFMEVKHEDSSGEKEVYCLRPMNCPHHHRIFSSRMRSYRELPIRLAEYGHVYRYEDSGAVSGLLRVRGMCMNDAHVYCTEEQIQEEFLKVMEMHKTLYRTLGIKNYFMRFSTWDPDDPKGKDKFVNNPEAWEKSQALVLKAMQASGLDFVEGKGEAAFYGPKIDFQFKTVTGREETASTNQLDFAVPERLGMSYVGKDNLEHRPYIIHRAPAGTHERFVAFLIEHFAGAFPLWLAPVQVCLIPVAEKFVEYCEKINKQLRSQFIRSQIDLSGDSFNKKIRNNAKKKIPCLLIVGEKEQAEESVTLRYYGVKEQQVMKVQAFEAWLKKHIAEKTLAPFGEA